MDYTRDESLPLFIYKIVSPAQWQESLKQGVVSVGPIDSDFIHFSTAEQLPSVLKKFWSNQPHAVLVIETSKLEGNLVFEANLGGTNEYPHLYQGKIPLSAVVEVI